MKAAHHRVWATELPKRIAPTYRVANFLAGSELGNTWRPENLKNKIKHQLTSIINVFEQK